MRRHDPNSELWHFLPPDPVSEASFRGWNIVIISILGALVLGLLLLAVVPPYSVGNASTATKHLSVKRIACRHSS
jgi:hypothetical protein